MSDLFCADGESILAEIGRGLMTFRTSGVATFCVDSSREKLLLFRDKVDSLTVSDPTGEPSLGDSLDTLLLLLKIFKKLKLPSLLGERPGDGLKVPVWIEGGGAFLLGNIAASSTSLISLQVLVN